MRTITKQAFTFDELSDEAKEKAREWYRGGDDGFYAECAPEDAATIADILGIDLRQRPVKLVSGQTRYDPAIYYSCPCSQGDGACFDGKYRYKAGAAKAIREYMPHDAELHRIADQLKAVQRQNFYQLRATCSHSGHYCHSGCMSVDVWHDADRYRDIGGAEDDITQLLRDFADWIYDRLEAGYEHQNSDETVDENIRANDYEFYENGEIA